MLLRRLPPGTGIMTGHCRTEGFGLSFMRTFSIRCTRLCSPDEVFFLSKVEELGYKVQVLMHPNMDVAVSEFEISDKINMMSYDTPIGIFLQSDLIVTDYSSVAFDFVYLRKPVIYYQPDREEFFSGSHTYVQGYFDYDKDGFGEVCTDSEILKNTILSYLENGCTLKEMYKGEGQPYLPLCR